MEYSNITPGNLPEDKKLTVVKFSTKTCGPCRVLKPQFENLSKKENLAEDVNFLSINPQENMDWITETSINSVPTTIGFVDNKEVFRFSGTKIDKIKELIEEQLKNL